MSTKVPENAESPAEFVQKPVHMNTACLIVVMLFDMCATWMLFQTHHRVKRFCLMLNLHLVHDLTLGNEHVVTNAADPDQSSCCHHGLLKTTHAASTKCAMKGVAHLHNLLTSGQQTSCDGWLQNNGCDNPIHECCEDDQGCPFRLSFDEHDEHLADCLVDGKQAVLFVAFDGSSVLLFENVRRVCGTTLFSFNALPDLHLQMLLLQHLQLQPQALLACRLKHLDVFCSAHLLLLVQMHLLLVLQH